MFKLLKKSIIALFILSPIIFIAQNQKECYNTVKYCHQAKRQGYIYNMQSESGAFVQGDTAEITIIVYRNMEYRISLCSPSHSELNGNFEFKIVENITKGEWQEVVKDGETKRKRIYITNEVIRYDNTEDENNQEFIFQSNKTRKISVKIYIPEMSGEENYDLSGASYSCVGLLIEHQKGVVTGFNR